ncbi:hypothetical protein SAMN05428974_3214 [Sphingopyxis sp. YR583]|uniref:DUF2274 domain-containing protein n=1 Tax=Sphingopyxis sp. YR583 TaxID=1881047 RepID=UPI0008A74D7E|nr:DUF2274 domain-containing protein [Sphingopyxis sp. YR583]SEH19114.1 hypothetical protein SAMN05428974_3214 [Sphingopyxis sp. YR583]
MAGLRLPKLPDRTPVKISILVMPELNDRLTSYAALYARTYGADVTIAELIPAMVGAFLDGDREFAKLERTAKP